MPCANAPSQFHTMIIIPVFFLCDRDASETKFVDNGLLSSSQSFLMFNSRCHCLQLSEFQQDGPAWAEDVQMSEWMAKIQSAMAEPRNNLGHTLLHRELPCPQTMLPSFTGISFRQDRLLRFSLSPRTSWKPLTIYSHGLILPLAEMAVLDILWTHPIP